MNSYPFYLRLFVTVILLCGLESILRTNLQAQTVFAGLEFYKWKKVETLKAEITASTVSIMYLPNPYKVLSNDTGVVKNYFFEAALISPNSNKNDVDSIWWSFKVKFVVKDSATGTGLDSGYLEIKNIPGQEIIYEHID